MQTLGLQNRPFLELLLILMGLAGIALTVIVCVLIVASSLFIATEDSALIYSVVLGIIGFTAGIGLIALSQILGYLRIIATHFAVGRNT